MKKLRSYGPDRDQCLAALQHAVSKDDALEQEVSCRGYTFKLIGDLDDHQELAWLLRIGSLRTIYEVEYVPLKARISVLKKLEKLEARLIRDRDFIRDFEDAYSARPINLQLELSSPTPVEGFKDFPEIQNKLILPAISKRQNRIAQLEAKLKLLKRVPPGADVLTAYFLIRDNVFAYKNNQQVKIKDEQIMLLLNRYAKKLRKLTGETKVPWLGSSDLASMSKQLRRCKKNGYLLELIKTYSDPKNRYRWLFTLMTRP